MSFFAYLAKKQAQDRRKQESDCILTGHIIKISVNPTQKGQRMNFNVFQEKVAESLSGFYKGEATAEVKQIVKNNGVIRHGVVISGKEENVSPTIYLEEFYDSYLEGKEFGRIIEEIIKIYEENKVMVSIDMDFFMDYERVRGRMFLKVIHYEKNEKQLSEIPHERFLDLAVVVYYAYMNDYLGKGTIQITVSHLDGWGVSWETLYKDAERNTKEKLGLEIISMKNMLKEMLSYRTDKESLEQIEDAMNCMDDDRCMHVLTLRGRYYGAAVICFPEMLQVFGEQCGHDFYILPSSVHELIAVPSVNEESPEKLKCMVREVNEACVEQQEQLSDNIYYFDISSNKVILI